MSMSPQMESIVEQISQFKLALATRQAEEDDGSRQILDSDTFCLLLSGLPSFRRLPGVPEHMGFDGLYRCDSPEHTAELKSYLEDVFGIHDADTLQTQKTEFFHIGSEYYDFACEWDGHPNFQPEDLDEEELQYYIASRDFASQLRDLVGTQGFQAWDVGERIMLTRAALACGLIDEQTFRDLVVKDARIASLMFTNFIDYAVSALCGCVYYMFVTMERVEDEGLSGFLDINMKIISNLFETGIWDLNSWCDTNYKQLAIREDQVQQLLPETMESVTGVASDRILCDGFRVAVMFREAPKIQSDSGWRFLAGDEDEAFLANPENFGAFPLNLIANYSPDIIPFLESPVGAFFLRDEEGNFITANNSPVSTPSGDPIAYG